MADIDLTETFENAKNNVDFITINIDGEDIRVPNFISMNSIIEYEKEYEKTKDTRMAFCKLLLDVVKNYGEEKVEFNFNELEDEQLIEIMKFIVKDDNYYEPFFKENNLKYTFNNFYKAYEFKKKEMAEMISKPLQKNIDLIQKVTRNISKPFIDVQNYMSSLNNIANMYKASSSISIMEPVKSSTLIKAVAEQENEKILDSKSPQEILDEIVEPLNKQVEIMEIERDARIKSDRELLRRDRINFWLAIISLIIAVLSFIGLDNILILLKIK